MEIFFSYFFDSFFVGVIATLFMDVITLFLKHAFGVTPLNYALVGRLALHSMTGKFYHENIVVSPKVNGESIVGWILHYLIGVLFAAAFIFYLGDEVLTANSVLLAVGFGLLTVIFPFFIMQPAMGFGFASAKLSTPKRVRLRSLLAHGVFGFGLYLGVSASKFL